MLEPRRVARFPRCFLLHSLFSPPFSCRRVRLRYVFVIRLCFHYRPNMFPLCSPHPIHFHILDTYCRIAPSYCCMLRCLRSIAFSRNRILLCCVFVIHLCFRHRPNILPVCFPLPVLFHLDDLDVYRHFTLSLPSVVCSFVFFILPLLVVAFFLAVFSLSVFSFFIVTIFSLFILSILFFFISQMFIVAVCSWTINNV